MNKRNFRIVLAASIVAGLCSAFVDDLIPDLLPSAFKLAQEAAKPDFFNMSGIVGIAGSVVAFALLVCAYVGLFRFRSWAPRLAVISTAVSIACGVLIGASAQLGLATALNDISSLLLGVALALAYFSPIAARFSSIDT